jgi:hypothetical protein
MRYLLTPLPALPPNRGPIGAANIQIDFSGETPVFSGSAPNKAGRELFSRGPSPKR